MMSIFVARSAVGTSTVVTTKARQLSVNRPQVGVCHQVPCGPSTSRNDRDVRGLDVHSLCARNPPELLPDRPSLCAGARRSVSYTHLDVYKRQEQTPEGFVRHTTEILLALKSVLTPNGSIWWNIMDTFNTRTQIRGNAVEALRAMQGRDSRAWGDHESRRYSAGHSYLKDGEQCMIPSMIAERASRIGYYVKSTITWAKTATLPEPQESRVSRNLEYILHLSLARAPSFNKECYRTLPAAFGGRNNGWETDKLSDVWTLPTSSGGDGHGAQFPIALPGRCIALSTNEGELVLDPFVGAGTSGVAALALGRRFIGIDVSPDYLQTAQRRLKETKRLRPSDYKPSGAKMAAE